MKIYLVLIPYNYRCKETCAYTGVNETQAIYWHSNVELIIEWEKELYSDLKGQGYNVELFDMFGVTCDLDYDPANMLTSEVSQFYAVDMLHPNDRGYRMMAKAVYEGVFMVK